MTNSSNKFEVTLNSAAHGLADGENVREVSAAKYSYSETRAGYVFMDGNDNEVAFFQNVTGVIKK